MARTANDEGAFQGDAQHRQQAGAAMANAAGISEGISWPLIVISDAASKHIGSQMHGKPAQMPAGAGFYRHGCGKGFGLGLQTCGPSSASATAFCGGQGRGQEGRLSGFHGTAASAVAAAGARVATDPVRGFLRARKWRHAGQRAV